MQLKTMLDVRARLHKLRDPDYRAFQCALIPTVPPESVLGVRIPALRALAAEMDRDDRPLADAFMAALPHRTYDENNLHALLILRIADFDACLAAVEAFLPYVDNWATCDTLSPKAFRKNLPALVKPIKTWIASGHTYAVRFAVGTLMRFYLDEAFSPAYLSLAANISSEEYYVNMMIAWYFATALAKQYDAALPYLENRALERWTHNKAIQKAVESYRVPDEKKAYLRTLKY